MNKDDEKYDAIIDINSIMKLKDGWDIKYNGDEKRINQTKSIIQSNNKSFISILGHSNRGKTYILQKICGIDLNPGYEITTKGISLKVYGENSILLDTVGSNAPLLVEDKTKDPRDGKDFYQEKINEINLCQIITNYIVQTFVIQNADILICVVGMLTSSEQQFLNKIKKNCSGKKTLIVIHNLIHCYEKKEIENYIENVLKKSIIHRFEEINITEFEGDEQNFNKYFIEKNNGEGHEFDIKHFILANDTNRNSNEIRFFNEPTIKYIRDLIDHTIIKPVNILQNLINHIKIISNQVLENELNDVQIIKNNNNNDEKIICSEKIKAKEVTADELDNIHFIGKEYEPPFRYYKLNDKFIIEIQLCCNVDINKLQITLLFFKENEEFLFKIEGEKQLENNKNSNDIIEIHELINKRNWKNFKIEFKIRMKDYEIDGLEEIDKNDSQALYMEYGILFLKFNVE